MCDSCKAKITDEDIDLLFEVLMKAEDDEREDEAMSFRDIVTANENVFASAIEKMFQKQKNEVKTKLNNIKALEDMFMFDTTVWNANTRIMAEKYLKKAMNENGKRVFDDLKKIRKTAKFFAIAIDYEMEYPEAIEWVETQGVKLADDVTEETESIIADIIATAFREGLIPREVAKLIDGSFDNKSRAMMIARTEIVRASNYGALSSYKQSGVVQGKEWLTAQDEKVCPYCGGLNGKVLGLSESYLPVGGILEFDGRSMTNNYLDVQAPPVHPRCRCTILPVLEEITNVVTTPKFDLNYQTYGMVDNEFIDEGKKIIESLPDNVVKWVEKAKIEIAFAEHTTKARPDLKGVRPRGWADGMTWDSAEGFYSHGGKNKKQLLVAQNVSYDKGKTFRPGRPIADVLPHELGHAVDDAIGGASNTPEFIKAHMTDVSKLEGYAKMSSGYFMQKGKAGRSETFAELFGHHIGGNLSKNINKRFPESRKVMLQILKDLK